MFFCMLIIDADILTTTILKHLAVILYDQVTSKIVEAKKIPKKKNVARNRDV